MTNTYKIEHTDTFGGEANYSWVRRTFITMPELTHYGYDGGYGYAKANKTYERELMRKAKAAMGLTGVRGTVERWGEIIAFRPYKSASIMFIDYVED